MTVPSPEQSRTVVVSDSLRESIRGAARELAEFREIPAEQFPGHKGIACANLEGYLGGFTLYLLSALEERKRELIRAVQDAAEARAALNRVRVRVADAERLLTPGMRAGTAEAKAILKETCS